MVSDDGDFENWGNDQSVERLCSGRATKVTEVRRRRGVPNADGNSERTVGMSTRGPGRPKGVPTKVISLRVPAHIVTPKLIESLKAVVRRASK